MSCYIKLTSYQQICAKQQGSAIQLTDDQAKEVWEWVTSLNEARERNDTRAHNREIPVGHEMQGTYDPRAAGHERQGLQQSPKYPKTACEKKSDCKPSIAEFGHAMHEAWAGDDEALRKEACKPYNKDARYSDRFLRPGETQYEYTRRVAARCSK